MRRRYFTDYLPSESDIEYMFDTFFDEVEDYIKPTNKEAFLQRLEYLQRDIHNDYDIAYEIFEAIEPLKNELERY